MLSLEFVKAKIKQLVVKNLKPMLNDNGYHYVTLCNSGSKRNHYVHQLIATVFIDNPTKKKHVNHKNLKKIDNNVENLEWVTPSENMQHYHNNSTTSS
jgi:hypothetical protein